jgi:phosphatidylethanolamine/phosphatidyl-N-methylethanolamine N-methyltransferase
VLIVSHFSVEKGPRAFVERNMARFSGKLGWRPNFPIETVLGHPGLRLVERRPVKAMDLFTLLVFERVEPA